MTRSESELGGLSSVPINLRFQAFDLRSNIDTSTEYPRPPRSTATRTQCVETPALLNRRIGRLEFTTSVMLKLCPRSAIPSSPAFNAPSALLISLGSALTEVTSTSLGSIGKQLSDAEHSIAQRPDRTINATGKASVMWGLTFELRGRSRLAARSDEELLSVARPAGGGPLERRVMRRF